MLARPRPRAAQASSGADSAERWAASSPLPQHALFGTGHGRKEKKFPVDKDMLESTLQEVRGLTEEELYDELSGWEEDPGKLRRRRQTEGQLRQEVDKLCEEVETLQHRCSAAQSRALEAQASQVEAMRRSEFQLGLVKRQLQSLKRGTSAASGLAQHCRDCQRKAELFDLEREALQKESAMKKKAWQEAEQEAAHLAEQLASLEQQKAKSLLAGSSLRQQAASSQAADGEAGQLLAERTQLQQQLRKTREMVELSQLLTDERMLLEKRKMSSGEILREIAELEEQADDVERNGQRVVGEMRRNLERLAQRSEDLRKAKDQAEDWLGAVWAALNQQRREQLLLHRRVKEEDQWASRLQERTEALVDELAVLERQAQPQSTPSQGQEETWCTLALLQQRRKTLKKDLSSHLAMSRHVHGKLKDAEGEQKLLLEQLRPLQPMLRSDGES